MISFSLAHDDIRAAARPSANEADWDHRYGGDQMWSGNPNGTLVNEISGLTPGRALDVGAGEGGDALWLAEQGWNVTASDISQRALDRVAAEAERRGLRVECHHADANALDAFEAAAFDLVSAQYASIPRTPDGRGVRNLLNAVAPGGTLLVVGHDLEPMRAPIDTRGPQPAVRPRCLRPGRRLRSCARRLTGMGHRGPREATPPGRGRLCLAPRRRHRAACPTPRQLTASPAMSRIRSLLRPRVNAASGAAVTQGEHHGQVPVAQALPRRAGARERHPDGPVDARRGRGARPVHERLRHPARGQR